MLIIEESTTTLCEQEPSLPSSDNNVMGTCPNCQKHFSNLHYCPEHGVPLRENEADISSPETTLEKTRIETPSPFKNLHQNHGAETQVASQKNLPLSKKPEPEEEVSLEKTTPAPIKPDTKKPKKKKEKDAWLGQTLGNYQLRKLLGVGGMGTVYLAEHNVLPKKAAVKLLKKEFIALPEVAERFQREAKAAAEIGHENVVEIFDFGQREDNTVYLIMEFLQGKSLAKLLRTEGPLSPKRAHSILRPICLGLSAAHERGIVHRDLKPDNIFISEQPTPEGMSRELIKILDFGIAKVNNSLSRKSNALTGTGMILGTPYYMSPEQAEGAEIDSRSDIYSLGVILYEMLVGRVPFNADTLGKILIKHISEPPLPLRKARPDLSISRPVEDVILQCLSKNPSERPQDAKTLLSLFEGALEKEGKGFVGLKTPIAFQTLSPKGRGGVWAAILGFVVLGALAVGAYVLSSKNTVPANRQPSPSKQVETLPASVPVTQAKPAKNTETPTPLLIRTITIQTNPVSAKVYRENQTEALGETPFPLELNPSEEISLILRAQGYKDEQISLEADAFSKDQKLSYELQIDRPSVKKPNNGGKKPGRKTPPTPKPGEKDPKDPPDKPKSPPKIEEGQLVNPFSKKKTP